MHPAAPGLPREMVGDFRFALRRLRRSPAFALVAIVTVALGIGSATAIYSVASAVVFRPLPFPDEERLVWIWSTRPDRDRAFFSIPNFLDLRRDATTTADLAAITPATVNVTGLGEPEQVPGWRVTPNLFSVLGVEAHLGRLPSPSDNVASAGPAAVLGHGYWQRRFGGDPAIVGRTITLSGAPHVVTGVLPRSFIIPTWDNDIVVAQALEAHPRRGERGTAFLRGIARLKPGVSLAQAQDEFTTLNRRLAELHPDTNAAITAPRLLPLRDEVVGGYRASLLMLLAAAGALLAILCANLAGLLAARGLARQRDAALCSALGASRGRLLRLYLSEGLIIAFAGGAVGVLLCGVSLPALLALAPSDLPRANQVHLDFRVLGVALGCVLLTGLGIGIAPALRLARTAPLDVLKGSFGGATSRAAARQLLVAAQIALCTVLLVGAGLLTRSLAALLASRPGFESAGVLTAQTLLPGGNYRDLASVIRFADESFRRLRALPGVQRASLTTVLPLTGINTRSEFTRSDRPPANPADTLSAANRFVAEGYFATVGIPLLAGRDFRTDDDAARRPVVIIDQALAQAHWPGEDAVGKTIRFREPTLAQPRELEIVGVVGPTKNFSLEERGTPTVYLPFRQMVPGSVSFFTARSIFVLKTASDPLSLRDSVRRELHAVEPNAALSLRSFEEAIAWARAPRIFNLRLLGFFAGAAVLLAVIGLYAITAQAVTARTREIGIRLALGANPARMTRTLFADGARLTLAGIVGGLGLAAMLSPLMARMLYDVNRFDGPTYGAAAALLALVALLATWLPARRAARVEPLAALRSE